jgi:uroporphyrinogen-III decarboxylase
MSMSVASDSNLLIRALKGESVERIPVWLMRQVLSPANHLIRYRNLMYQSGWSLYG